MYEIRGGNSWATAQNLKKKQRCIVLIRIWYMTQQDNLLLLKRPPMCDKYCYSSND